MSSRGNGQSVPFDVQISAQTKAEVQRLHAQAVLAGTGPQFLAAFRQIVEHLLTTPLAFVEALFHLPALQLQVRQTVVMRLVVDYTVDADRPLVFIRGFKLLS